jgi:hypothetical protein
VSAIEPAEPVVPVEPAVPVPNRSVPYLPEPTGMNRCEPTGAYRPEPVAEPTRAPEQLMHGRPAATPRNHNDNTARRRPWSGNCFGCGLPGHRVSDCPTKRAAGVSDRDRGPSETYIIERTLPIILLLAFIIFWEFPTALLFIFLSVT